MIWSARGFAPLLLFFSFLWVCPLHAQTQGLDGLLEGAGVAQSSGHYAEAAALYAQATALAPSQPELWSNRGVMEFLSGQIDASITSLKRASVLDPHLFTPLLFLGKDYLQTGKSASALPYLNQAHTLKPNDPEVLLALGKINLDTGQPRTASALYADAVHIIPSNPAAWFGLGVSSLQLISADGWTLASTNAQSPWARSLYADELFAQGRPREATETYHALLAQATPATKTSLARNLAWMQAHEELLQLPPSSREALLALNAQIGPQTLHMATSPCGTEPLEDAACAYRKSNYERSAAEADKALRKTPQSAEALYWSVKANERIAVAALARFEELAPQSAANYVLVGNLYRFQNQAEPALGEYRKALAINPHDPSALLGAALASLSADQLPQATAFDQTALAHRPLDPQLNLLMAEILDTEGHEDQMEPYLAKCAAAPPELQSQVHYLLGRLYREQGKTEEAIAQWNLALPGDKDGSIHYQLARLYQKTGDTTQANALMAQAKALLGKRNANAFIAVREEAATSP
jgi:tetratricopeptide (TPR) repeat protein